MGLNKENFETLRDKAERHLKARGPGIPPEDDSRNLLIQELEVHQVELEMQKEELLKTQQQAKVLSEKYTALFDHAPMGYYNLDRNAKIMDLNFRGASLLGQERSWLKGKNFKLFIGEKAVDSFTLFFEKIFQTQTKQTCELSLSNEEDGPTYFYLKGIVSEDRNSCLLTAIDITRRKQAEKALKENEARLRDLNATKDKFFSIISHDLKSPFTSIVGLSKLLLKKIRERDFEDIEEYAEYIEVSSNRAMDLLDNLLEWSSAQTGKLNFSPTEINLKEIFSESIELSKDQARSKHIVINNNLNGDIVAYADKTMIGTVLRNLISNAVKFTNEGGTINVSAEEGTCEMMILVADNGIGIKEEVLEKLFKIDKSLSTKGTNDEVGTGLGLLLVKEFVHIHGGEIWVESKPGNGSTFFITLPKRSHSE